MGDKLRTSIIDINLIIFTAIYMLTSKELFRISMLVLYFYERNLETCYHGKIHFKVLIFTIYALLFHSCGHDGNQEFLQLPY